MKIRTYDRDGRLLSEREVQASAEERNADALRQRIDASLEANRAYLSLPLPSAGQTAAQIKLLTGETTAIIRLLLGRLEGTD